MPLVLSFLGWAAIFQSAGGAATNSILAQNYRGVLFLYCMMCDIIVSYNYSDRVVSLAKSLIV
jgi:hypothetical protein